MIPHQLYGGRLRSDKPGKSEAGTSVWGKVTFEGDSDGAHNSNRSQIPGSGLVVDPANPPTSRSIVMQRGLRVPVVGCFGIGDESPVSMIYAT